MLTNNLSTKQAEARISKPMRILYLDTFSEGEGRAKQEEGRGVKKSRSSHENPFIIPSLSNHFHSSIKILEPYLIILILQMRKPRSERLSNLSKDSQD